VRFVAGLCREFSAERHFRVGIAAILAPTAGVFRRRASLFPEAERLRPEKSEVNRLLGDATKLRTLTDWKPQYTFEQGLAETIEFLRGNLDQYKVGQYIL